MHGCRPQRPEAVVAVTQSFGGRYQWRDRALFLVGLYTGLIILVLDYALPRWGSGRDIVLGSALILTTFVLSAMCAPGDVPAFIEGLAR